MKKVLLGALAAMAISAPAYAATGYVGASYTDTNLDPGSFDSNSWGVDGAVAFDLSPGLGLALDAAYADSDDTDSTTAGTAHLFTRNDQYLFGAFAGASDSSGFDTWNAGLEGQYYLSNTTLGLAVSYVDADDINVTGWGANASAKFFLTDNFSLGGNVGWFTIDPGFGGNENAWTAGVGAEYQLASVPISVLASYNRFDGDDSGVTADVFSVGVRYNFNGTLKQRSHDGADLSGLSGVRALQF